MPSRPANDGGESGGNGGDFAGGDAAIRTNGNQQFGGQPQQGYRERPDRGDRGDRGDFHDRRNGRRHRRGRGRGPRRDNQQGGGGGGGGGEPRQQQPQQPMQITPVGETRGWFDTARDAGFIRRAAASYLAEQGDAYVPPHVVRQFALRRADLIDAAIGYDQRGRPTVCEIRTINGEDPQIAAKRPEFNSLPASYPERKLFLETGRPAKGGPELTRRAVDLIAPIGYGQRALIVAPARAGKTTLLHAITEGVAVNHPNAVLLILLVDERPEEVSEAISWGVGEVISSSFDQPAQRHVEVTEMVLNRAHRLVESGKDVVIVLDSLTRMARAHNTAERGTGRTLSGGLDATAMAKPKAFFGSARSIPETSGGGSLTIIATALVETGSRMDDVIFEEFKGTGNCEIKLDRSLAEKRIYPAIDIATSGTRREEKLFRPDQIDSVYTLRRGLSQMPPQSAMEWLIKRIAATASNDALLAGL
ncbi:MAG TPA: transcription termination factor Rho [Gemmatimonadaceae bacterium]|nr:transcription termination factor Rho [Gemmatimonadaceae bacterium]